MRDLKYLKTFESFSPVLINEEELIGDLFKKGPISKAVNKFKEDNKEAFLKLKDAEKIGGKDLKSIQDILNKKLIDFKRGEMRKLLPDQSDFNTAGREIGDIINNINANDKRSTFQKVGSGASSGFPGREKK